LQSLMSNVLNVEEGLAETGAEVRDGYRWVAQECPVCEAPPGVYMGRRGGEQPRRAGHVYRDLGRQDWRVVSKQ